MIGKSSVITMSYDAGPYGKYCVAFKPKLHNFYIYTGWIWNIYKPKQSPTLPYCDSMLTFHESTWGPSIIVNI